MLTNRSHADVAQALGLIVRTSGAERVLCTSRRMSVVETPSSAPPCSPYQATSDEALGGSDDAIKVNSTPPSPAVNISQHQNSEIALEHQSGVGPSCAVPHEKIPEIEGREFKGTISHHTPLEDEMLSAGAKSPDTATKEATKHQEDSDDLFEADIFEPNSPTASPQSLYSCAQQDGQTTEIGSTSPGRWAKDQKGTTLISRHDQRNEELGLDRQSYTDPGNARRLRRRRSLHDSDSIVVVKRQRVDNTHAKVDQMRM